MQIRTVPKGPDFVGMYGRLPHYIKIGEMGTVLIIWGKKKNIAGQVTD